MGRLSSSWLSIYEGEPAPVSRQGSCLFAHAQVVWQYAFSHAFPFSHKSGETVSLSPLEFGDAYAASDADMIALAQSKSAPAFEGSISNHAWVCQGLFQMYSNSKELYFKYILKELRCVDATAGTYCLWRHGGDRLQGILTACMGKLRGCTGRQQQRCSTFTL